MSSLNVVVVGLEGSGKTLAMRQLRRTCTESMEHRRAVPMPRRTRSTTGVEIESFSCGSAELKVREVSSLFQLRWAKWIGKADVVVFVVDASDSNAAAAASTALLDVVAEAHQRAPCGLPVLVLLNKCERCASRGARARLRALLHLDLLQQQQQQQQQQVTVLDASAVTGEGFGDVAAWLEQTISVRPT